MGQEFEKLSKLEPMSKNYLIELQKIREAKVREIRNILDCLFANIQAYRRLRKDKTGEVIPFIQLIKETWRDLKKDAGDKPFIEVFGRPDMKESYSKAIDWMARLELEPTGSMTDVECLWYLWHYYNVTLNNPPTLIDMRLDLSLIKMLRACYTFYMDFEREGSRELTRIKKSIKIIKAKSEEKKNFVLEIYYRSRLIKSGMKLNTVIRIIENIFREVQNKGTELEGLGKISAKIKPPSPDQIRRYLDSEGILTIDFIKKGRFWILQR